MNVSIRKMLRDDIDTVHELESLIFKDAWSLKQIVSESDGKEYKKPYVMEVDGTIAGYTFIWVIADEVHINNFAVHPAFRRKGLGLKLISFIFERFKEYDKFFLEVRKSNEAAINLYRKCGFKTIFTRKRYYADGEDALVMFTNLK